VGTKSTASVEHYCREVETYLCRKNDGHLIRVVGPSFELVAGWATKGIPLKVAFRGVDRYFERYYRTGPRRRPVRIDFCEADVLDVFDEWRRALGLSSQQTGERPGISLPEHLERVVLRLTEARAGGSLGAAFDGLVDRVAAELDIARGQPGGLRGHARRTLMARLSALDAELVELVRGALDDSTRESLEREADTELEPFRSTMHADAFTRARGALIERLARERLKLPTLSVV